MHSRKVCQLQPNQSNIISPTAPFSSRSPSDNNNIIVRRTPMTPNRYPIINLPQFVPFKSTSISTHRYTFPSSPSKQRFKRTRSQPSSNSFKKYHNSTSRHYHGVNTHSTSTMMIYNDASQKIQLCPEHVTQDEFSFPASSTSSSSTASSYLPSSSTDSLQTPQHGVFCTFDEDDLLLDQSLVSAPVHNNSQCPTPSVPSTPSSPSPQEPTQKMTKFHQTHTQAQVQAHLQPKESAPFNCTKHNTPSHVSFSLSNISSLLSYVTRGSIVIFDIDETLVKRKHGDSSLLSQAGSKLFVDYLSSPACSYLSLEQRQQATQILTQMVRRFVEAEEGSTASIVRALQQRGCYVLCLTARQGAMADITNQTFEELGIDLLASLPPGLPKMHHDVETGSTVKDGVIYTNGYPKGEVFKRFLQQNWITFPEISPLEDTNTVQTHPSNTPCPDRTVWFIDDNYPMIDSVIKSWEHYSCGQDQLFNSLTSSMQSQISCTGKYNLVCCHYIHPTNYALNPLANVVPIHLPHVFHKVVAQQIYNFFVHNVVLNDLEAYQKIPQ